MTLNDLYQVLTLLDVNFFRRRSLFIKKLLTEEVKLKNDLFFIK